MKFADCVKETTTALTAAVIQLLGAVAQGKFRRFFGPFAISEGEICARMEDIQGNWELSLFTLTDANTLTRTKILSSSNNGAAVTFAAGEKVVFSTLPADALAEFLRASDGITVAELPRGVPQTVDLFPYGRAAGGDRAITFGDFLALVNGNPPASDGTAPSFPDALSSSVVTQTSFTLSWQAATDANGIARYEYSYDGSTWTTAGTALSVNLTGRTAGTTYNMRVRALDPSGNISTVRTLAVTTAAASGDTQAPSMSGSISTSNVTSSGYTFSWTAGTDNVGVDHYETSIDGGASWQTIAAGTLSRTVTGRPVSTTDNLRVRAHDAAGNISNVLSGTVTTLTDTPVVTYTITPNSSSSVPKTSVAASERTTDYTTTQRFVHVPALAASGAWKISPTPESAVAGWGTSNTVPPATITSSQNKAGSSSINGMTPMGNPSGNWTVTADLMTTGPGESGPYYLWIEPKGGAAFCTNASTGTAITAA